MSRKRTTQKCLVPQKFSYGSQSLWWNYSKDLTLFFLRFLTLPEVSLHYRIRVFLAHHTPKYPPSTSFTLLFHEFFRTMVPSVLSTQRAPSCMVEHERAKWSPWGPDSEHNIYWEAWMILQTNTRWFVGSSIGDHGINISIYICNTITFISLRRTSRNETAIHFVPTEYGISHLVFAAVLMGWVALVTLKRWAHW